MGQRPATAPLLAVEGLTVAADLPDRGHVELLQDVSLEMRPAELVGLVGESGAGKTLLTHAMLRLLRRPVSIDRGRVLFDGADLLTLGEAQLNDVRGGRIGLIPQDASLALNPVLRVEDQLAEVIVRHLDLKGDQVRAKSLDVLTRVGLAAPERVLRSFPNQLSGGMKQRVGIALALACDPVLLLADDPTSAVDVTIQAQILAELRGLADLTGVAILFITHDLRVISALCSRVLVLYAGQLIESGRVSDLLRAPRHPYTDALVGCSPSVEMRRTPLPVVPGAPPNEPGLISGCRFHPRCLRAVERCRSERPPLEAQADGTLLACWNPLDA